MAGVAAGEEDIGAEASSMDPKETTEPGKVQRMSNVQKKKSHCVPVFVAPTLRGILTPSFMGIP